MITDSDSDNNIFVFAWKIENRQMIFDYETIESPAFTIKKFLNTKWRLRLKLRESKANVSKISVCLFRADDNGPDRMQIGSSLCIEESCTAMFLENPKLTKNNELIFVSKEEGFKFKDEKITLSNSSFCVVCHLWMGKNSIETDPHQSSMRNALLTRFLDPGPAPVANSRNIGSSLEAIVEDVFPALCSDISDLQEKYCQFPNSCFARTVFPIEKKYFSWSVTSIRCGKDQSRSCILFTSSSVPSLVLKITCTEENYRERIEVDICLAESVSATAVIKIDLIGFDGELKKFIKEKHNFWPTSVFGRVYFVNIECEGNACLDRLQRLNCEILISPGKPHSWIETLPIETSESVSQGNEAPQSSLQRDISSLYACMDSSDVTLEVDSAKIVAHKTILSARSAVFSAMFERGMKEKESNSVQIDDMDRDTLNQMMLYMYSDKVQELSLEDYIKLYEAADKYQIVHLREICSERMISKVTVENFTELFYTADLHSDQKFKNSIMYFILCNVNQVLISPQWKIFLKYNVQLSNEILQEICMKLTHIEMG